MPGLRYFRTHGMNTANVVSFRDFCPYVATGSNRPCYVVHPDDNAFPLMLWVHGLYAKVCGSSTRLHVCATSWVRCCLVAHSGDNVCLRTLLTHGFHLAAGMGVLLVNPSLMDSQCAAGSHQAREPGGERNIHDRVLCRHAQLETVGQSSTHCCRNGEREDAVSEPYAGPSDFSNVSSWKRIKWVVNWRMFE